MGNNMDVAVMAKKIYELTALSAAQLEAQKWTALLLINAVISSATPAGVAKMNAEKEARWGDQIRQEGFMSALHPKWHLRTDDGKRPIVQIALESALDNPNRDLRTRLQALLFIPAADREPLTDLVRSLSADAFAGATGDAKNKYIDAMRELSPTWTKEPWLMVFPPDGRPPPLSILIDNQGATHDGGLHDDPSDDTEWEKAQFGWTDAIRTWDIDFLRDNPLAQFYLTTEKVATTAAETAGKVASGANAGLDGLAHLLRWAPYYAAALAGVVIVIAATKD